MTAETTRPDSPARVRTDPTDRPADADLAARVRTDPTDPTGPDLAGLDPAEIARREVLLALLDRIDAEGWDGAAGSLVLTYARDRVVRPQLRRIARRVLDLEQVESSGWCAAWEVLRTCRVTRPDSPWGLVTVAVRRAMLGEAVAQVYDAPVRAAWRLRAAGETPGRAVLDAPRVLHPAGPAPGSPLDLVMARMVALGWDRAELDLVVDWLGTRDGSVAGHGWRALARRSCLPAWKVRRAVVLLAGAPGWPGLVQRVGEVGPAVLDTAAATAAIRASLHPSHLSPVTAHRRAS